MAKVTNNVGIKKFLLSFCFQIAVYRGICVTFYIRNEITLGKT